MSSGRGAGAYDPTDGDAFSARAESALRQHLGTVLSAMPTGIMAGLLMAKRAVENILENEENFRKLVRLSLPTGALQLPPEINPNVFERHAERCTDADAASLRAAARCYIRAAYDANELVEFAYRGRAQKRLSDEQVVEYLDGALTACRKCKDALGTIVALLPQEAIAQQGRPLSRDMELEVEQRYGGGAMTTEASTREDTKALT